MEGQSFERKFLDEREKDILEKNRKSLTSIIEKNRDLEKILESGRFRPLRHSEYFYSLSDWKKITKLLKDLEGALYGIVENPGVKFNTENNIEHLVGNGIQTYSSLVKLYLEKVGATPEDEKRGKKDLSKKELEWFAKNKITWDLTLYYIDYLIDPANKECLIEEVSRDDGFLDSEEISELLRDSDKKPQNHFLELRLFNFFARARGYKSGISDLRGIRRISLPINLENFDEEFDSLGAEEFLDKEKVREYVRKFSNDKIKEAA